MGDNVMQTIHELAKASRLRTGWEESRVGLEKDPWLMIIPGRHGHVYQHAPGQPAFASNTRSRGLTVLRDVPGCVVLQNGDDGINATFPVESLPVVAKRLGLYKKRVLSPEQRERLAAYQVHFKKAKVQVSKIEPESTIATQDDVGVEQP